MSDIPPTVPSPTPTTMPEPPLARLAVASPPPPVSYVGSMEYRARPGLVTTIGVLSIVVACISALCSLMLGLETFAFFMISKISSGMAQPPAVTVVNAGPNVTVATANATTGTAATSAAAPTPGPNELPEPQRSVVVTAFGELQPLSDQRKSQLAALLTEHGRQLFPDDGNALTAASIRGMVKGKSSESAMLGKVEGSSWYVIPAGRITLFDDSAVFASTDATTSFSTTAPETIVPDSSISTTLTPQQVASIIANVQAQAGGKLNASQVATLQRELSAANQQYVDPNLIASPVQSVSPLPDGSIIILFASNVLGGQSGMMQINSRGQLQNSPTVTYNYHTSVTSRRQAFPFARMKIETWKFALVIGENVASIGLAIYLFVIGILALRQSLAGRRLHLVYAWLKLPLAVVGGIAITWLFTAFFSLAPGGAFAGTGMIYSALWMSFIACIYPIALIITLNTRSLRQYYKPESKA